MREKYLIENVQRLFALLSAALLISSLPLLQECAVHFLQIAFRYTFAGHIQMATKQTDEFSVPHVDNPLQHLKRYFDKFELKLNSINFDAD